MILEKIAVGKQPRSVIFNVPYTEYPLVHDYVGADSDMGHRGLNY